MNRITLPGALLAFLLLLPAAGHAAPGAGLDPAPLLPRPAHVQTTAEPLTLHDGLKVLFTPSAPPRVREIADFLCAELRSIAGITAQVEPRDGPDAPGSVRLTLAPDPGGTSNPESYTLTVAQSAEVRASDVRGLLWGVQTFLQGLEPGATHASRVAAGSITDAPAYAWRAVMLDPVRSFLDLDFIRRTIRVMSAYKLNILHLHLIDDHAWRFESKAFPRCNRPGEPFYTQAELRELVAFAQRYGVEIIPEFDFPGHAHAAVDAYPELDCEGQTRPMDEAIFCAGKPFTWEFIDRVLAEAVTVFPSAYIHLGADEPFAVKRWATCPYCQARMKDRGVTTTAALYHTFVSDLDALVQRHGRRMIVWNDAITPDVAPLPPRDILIDAWTNSGNVAKLAQEGYTLVNTSSRPLYLSSYGQREGFGLHAVWQWTPTVFGLREAKSSDPDLQSVPLPATARVLGGQVAAWATEQRRMERRLYPRLLAVAETLWSGPNRGDFADFSARLAAGQVARLRRLGVPDDDALPVQTPFGGSGLPTGAPPPPAGFSLAEGVLHVPGDAGGSAWSTKAEYQDFILTFERRAAENTGETGFVIRCAPGDASAPPRGFRVRSTPPAGMRISDGDVRDLKGWNQFELVARGPVVSLTINGYLAWSQPDSAPRAGPIALVGDRGGFELRNVQLRSLDAPAAR